VKIKILSLTFLALVASVMALAQSSPEPQFLRRHEAVITALDMTKHRASFTVTPKNTTKFKEPFVLSDYYIDPDRLTVLVRYGRSTPSPANPADLRVGARIQLTASTTLSNGSIVSEIILLRDRK
jgi:hypothetical protein